MIKHNIYYTRLINAQINVLIYAILDSSVYFTLCYQKKENVVLS